MSDLSDDTADNTADVTTDVTADVTTDVTTDVTADSTADDTAHNTADSTADDTAHNAADSTADSTADELAAWWATDLTRIAPGVITMRGRPIQDLIGSTSFVEMLWLLLRGDMPEPRQAALLEAALVAGVDHGTQAPSIASARMAATCGVGLNNAIANGVNVLGDIHGGAGQQCVEILLRVNANRDDKGLSAAVADELHDLRYVPGFGHRTHPIDPRREPLLRLVEQAAADGIVTGRHREAALEIEAQLNRAQMSKTKPKPVPMNIDGATAVIYAELGFPAPLARGFFVLSRSVGILANAWEEMQGGRRIKGPLPPQVFRSLNP